MSLTIESLLADLILVELFIGDDDGFTIRLSDKRVKPDKSCTGHAHLGPLTAVVLDLVTADKRITIENRLEVPHLLQKGKRSGSLDAVLVIGDTPPKATIH